MTLLLSRLNEDTNKPRRLDRGVFHHREVLTSPYVIIWPGYQAMEVFAFRLSNLIFCNMLAVLA